MQPYPIHLLNDPAQHFANEQDPSQPKQGEQVQCIIVEQYYMYANSIHVTRRYSLRMNFVTHRTGDIVSGLQTSHSQIVIVQPVSTQPDPIHGRTRAACPSLGAPGRPRPAAPGAGGFSTPAARRHP